VPVNLHSSQSCVDKYCSGRHSSLQKYFHTAAQQLWPPSGVKQSSKDSLRGQNGRHTGCIWYSRGCIYPTDQITSYTNHCCSVPKTWRDRWDRRVSLKPLTAEWCDRTSMGQADSTEGTWLPCDNTALVLVLLAMCEVCKRTSELSCLSVSYCYLHSFTFRKSDLVLNIMLTLCVVWLRLGLPEAASSAISCPVSADLGYRYVDICVCPTMF